MENQKNVGFNAPSVPSQIQPSDTPSPKLDAPTKGLQHGGTVDTSPRPMKEGGMAQGSTQGINPKLP